MLRFLSIIIIGLTINSSVAANEQEMKKIKADLVRSVPELKSATIRPSPIPGMYEIEFDSKVFYTSRDGKYLFMGDVLEVSSRSNLTEIRRESIRNRLLDDVGEKNMIVIGPEKPRRTLTVFTDVDCPYCSKFHLDVPELNKNGVKVRYLMFPRTGLNGESYRRAVSVWCAQDRVKAIGIAKAGGKLEMKTCANPVESHYRLGQRLEIGGTPAIFVDDGKVFPGYIPAQRLLGMLGLQN